MNNFSLGFLSYETVTVAVTDRITVCRPRGTAKTAPAAVSASQQGSGLFCGSVQLVPMSLPANIRPQSAGQPVVRPAGMLVHTCQVPSPFWSTLISDRVQVTLVQSLVPSKASGIRNQCINDKWQHRILQASHHYPTQLPENCICGQRLKSVANADSKHPHDCTTRNSITNRQLGPNIATNQRSHGSRIKSLNIGKNYQCSRKRNPAPTLIYTLPLWFDILCGLIYSVVWDTLGFDILVGLV